MTDRSSNHGIASAEDAQRAAIVSQWYDLIDRGRTAEACLLFRDDIAWIEPEGSPYGAPGSALVGAAEIVSEVFTPLARDWSELRVVPRLMLPGQPVIVFGRYVYLAPYSTGVSVRARLDSGFYGDKLLAQMERARVTYLCGVPFNPRIIEAIRAIDDEFSSPCVDKDDGEVAEFGYRLSGGKVFRRYIVKRIAIEPGEQATLETGGYRYWVLVTNDQQRSAVELESEHRHKALVEAGMRELKSNYGLGTIRRHGFMANWAWLLLVCLAHNLCCWTQQLGQLAGGRDGVDLRAKRFRYRYLIMPAMLVRSARQRTIRVPCTWPHRQRILAALERLKRLGLTPA